MIGRRGAQSSAAAAFLMVTALGVLTVFHGGSEGRSRGQQRDRRPSARTPRLRGAAPVRRAPLCRPVNERVVAPLSTGGLGSGQAAVSAASHQWYAAPNGLRAGHGTADSPWDLATALAGGPGGTVVQPGDRIWLRGGTYTGGFECDLLGTAEAPILVRNYTGERVILDQAGARKPPLYLPASSAYVWIWGLEFTNSEPTRTTSVPGSAPPIPRGAHPELVIVRAPNSKLINCIAHDGGDGFTMWEEAIDSEIYGCLSFNNGWHGPDRGHGHGVYTQNVSTDDSPSRRLIGDTITWNNFDAGLHAYGEGDQHVQNIRFDGCVSFNNGAPEAAYTARPVRSNNLVAAAYQTCRQLSVQDCCFYHPANASALNLELGYSQVRNEDITLSQNLIAGGSAALYLRNWRSATVTGNTMVARTSTGTDFPELLCRVLTADGNTPAGYAWDQTTYFDATGMQRPFECSGSPGGKMPALTFTAWRAQTGFDGSSSYGVGLPQTNQVIARPNAYEPGRADLIVYNWQHLNTVSIDLSGVGLAEGQAFEIRNVQDYLGKGVVEGRYSSARPIISLPMIDPGVTAPIGFDNYPISSTLPEFGAFLVVPTTSG